MIVCEVRLILPKHSIIAVVFIEILIQRESSIQPENIARYNALTQKAIFMIFLIPAHISEVLINQGDSGRSLNFTPDDVPSL